MKIFLTKVILFILSVVVVNQAIAENLIWFDTSPVSPITAGQLPADVELTFSFYYNSEVDIWGGTGNDFIFHSQDSATWSQLAITLSQHLPTFQFYNLSNGYNSDTIHIWANPIWDFDLNAGFAPPVFKVKTTISDESIGKTLCIDSLNSYRSDVGDLWFWGDIEGDPIWQGEQCFTIVDCCYDYKGDVDFDGSTNINDLVYLIDFMFRGGSPIPCVKQADLDGDENLNITDLTRFVQYLFQEDVQVACQ